MGPLQQLPLPDFGGDGLLGGDGNMCPDCNSVVSCIQTQFEPADMSIFSSSQVILGLTPTLLSMMAPSVGEICMLSSNRPFLGALLSLGGPSIFCFRVLTYDDPLANLTPSNTFFSRTPMRRQGLRPRILRNIVSGCEYVLTSGAIGNVMYTSWILGHETILSWRCEISYYPFVWTSMAMAVHLVASGSWLCSRTMQRTRAAEKKKNRHPKESLVLKIKRWIRNEFTLCGAQDKRDFLDNRGVMEPRSIVFANLFAQATSFVLVIFGSFTLSSLLLIGTTDAFLFVLRYLLSALACRSVLMFELSGMAAVENEYRSFDARSNAELSSNDRENSVWEMP